MQSWPKKSTFFVILNIKSSQIHCQIKFRQIHFIFHFSLFSSCTIMSNQFKTHNKPILEKTKTNFQMYLPNSHFSQYNHTFQSKFTIFSSFSNSKLTKTITLINFGKYILISIFQFSQNFQFIQNWNFFNIPKNSKNKNQTFKCICQISILFNTFHSLLTIKQIFTFFNWNKTHNQHYKSFCSIHFIK